MRTQTEVPTLAVIDDTELMRALDDAVAALRADRIPFLVIGGIASAVWGRDRGTTDIDLFVRPESVAAVVDALEREGFESRRSSSTGSTRAVATA